MLKPDMGGDQFSPDLHKLAGHRHRQRQRLGTGTTTGGGTKHNNMPPTSFMNVMVKL